MKLRLAAVFLLISLFTSLLPLIASGQQPAPTPPASIQLAGLRDQVTIRRDERGIAYIEAKNDEDLYFAQGFITATDRMWQMELFRRTERGELAEVLTAGPNNIALDQDKQHRTLGFARVAEAEVAQASPKTRGLLEAYAAGVNAYIATLNAKSLPPEFQILQFTPKRWTPADSLLVVKLFAEALSNTWRLDLMREGLSALPAEKRAALMPNISPLDVLVVGKDVATRAANSPVPKATAFSSAAIQALVRDQEIAVNALERVGLYAEGLAASNNWVVNGKHTVTGKPLLANDPHLAPSAPSIWHMVHLSAPGIRVAGVTAPGMPGIIIGHNDRVAWGVTNVGADVQDLYSETFDPQNRTRYQTPTGWREAEIRKEEIKVRKGFIDQSTDTVTHEVTVTRHGPIIFERDGKRYALRWTALDPKTNSADLTYVINRARNWKEFTAALGTFTPPAQNIVYADVDGHIGYHVVGVVPIRKSGDGSIPYDGSTDEGEWTSYIPTDKLPQVFDPPSGIIVTANQRIVGTDYPYFLTHSWAQPYRARRIYNLLSEKPKLSTDDFRRVLGDVYSIGYAAFARQVSKILRPELKPEETKLKEALDSFDKWDGRVTADSKEALLLAQMRGALRSRVLAAALGPELVKTFGWSNFEITLDKIIKEQPKDWLPKEFTSYADLLRASFEDARGSMTKSLGPEESKWKWGESVKVRFQHPLAALPFIGAPFLVAPFPQNGTSALGATVNVGAAVSMRLIADTSDWDKTQHGITLGESGIPTSAHWQDQLEDWRAVTPRVFPFTPAAVAAAAKTTLVLTPK